jgi:hypothetical protein
MTSFSQRYGYSPNRPLNPILEETPDWLYLGFEMSLLDKYTSEHNSARPSYHQLALTIAYEFRLGGYSFEDHENAWNYIYSFMHDKWYRFYDFIELLGEKLRELDKRDEEIQSQFQAPRFNHNSFSTADRSQPNHFTSYHEDLNNFFIENNVGWRMNFDGFVKRELPVELKEQFEQVEQEVDQYQPVKEHLAKAKGFVTQRPLDPENSIKEIASALESLAMIYYPKESTLGAAAKIMGREKIIHGSMASLISIFYGFASDAPNVRHGSSDPSNLTITDAEFCLFAGTAMLGYLNKKLIEKSDQSL